jgi:hypothetical protein
MARQADLLTVGITRTSTSFLLGLRQHKLKQQKKRTSITTKVGRRKLES